MNRTKRQLVIPLLIAFLCVSLLSVLYWLRPSLLLPIDIAAADHLFVREDGPHLGRRRVHDDIVLVLIDAATMRARDGVLPTFQDDVRLYQSLMDGGASVVADTRFVAAASEDAMQEVRPLLEGMTRVTGNTVLFRDVWIPVNSSLEDRARWMPFIAPVVANMHPNAYRAFELRLFPLATYMFDGPTESMSLKIVRAHRGIPQVTGSEVSAELERCGIFMSWAPPRPIEEYRTRYPPSYRIGKLSIPWYAFASLSELVPPAAFWVSYDAAPSRFTRYSYQDMLPGARRGDVAGKIVIVGSDAQIDPTDQTYTIPTSLEKVSLAEVLGAATQTLLDERFPKDPSTSAKLVAALCLVAALTLAASRLRPAVAVLTSLILLFAYFVVVTFAYRHGWVFSVLLVPTTALLSGVLGGAYQLFLARQARSRIVNLFGRYVPRAVVQQLVQKPELEALVVGGIRRRVTVMFADIRGFTAFSEQLDPETVLTELNSLLDGMVACTFQAEGTLDKFIGDAILVLFNAPLNQPDHAQRAVETALNIQHGVVNHPSGLSIGIGIHTGDAVVGNIGTPERMEYTAIGSTVNIASRLCDVARPGEIVVSSDVAEQVRDQFELEARPPIRVKGIDRDLSTYLVRGQTT